MNQYIQVFRFLLNFSQLRDSVIRDVEKYDSVFWLNDLPESVQTIIQANNTNTDFWLKVVKPTPPFPKPVFPELPIDLRSWVVEDTLVHATKEPELKASMIDSKGTTIICPSQVEDAFLSYCINIWPQQNQAYKEEMKAFQEKEAEYQRISEIYRQLFDTFKKIQNFGDEYELVMGMGLLCQSEGTFIKRHIFTVRAAIEFVSNTRTAYIEVKPDLSNSRYFIESDMYQDLEGFNVEDAQRTLSSSIESAEVDDYFSEDFWGKDGLLNQYTNVLHTQAQYYPDIQRPTTNQSKPNIYFAPALILRRRTTRSLTAVYTKIIDQIEAGENFDASCVRAILETNAPIYEDFQRTRTFKDNTVFFPKLYNEEQISIVNRLRSNNKVLVQGPPGTGKSHTIANLMCHLLAHGNRVLVTAQTKRALESLKDKIPLEIQSLAVSMLGDDSKSASDLEQSVNTITGRLNNANLDALKKQVEINEQQLEKLKKSKAEYENELLILKERDTRKQRLNSQYEDTLDQLAKRLVKEQIAFDWFKDTVGELRERVKPEFCLFHTPDTWHDLAEVHYHFKELDALTRHLSTLFKTYTLKDFEQLLPSNTDLLSGEQLEVSLKVVDDFNLKYHNKIFRIIDAKDIDALGKDCEDWLRIERELQLTSTTEWAKRAVHDCLIRNSEHWEGLSQITGSFLQRFEVNQWVQEFDNQVVILAPTPLQKIRNDATILLNHLKETKKIRLSFSLLNKFLLPNNVKKAEYIVNQVQINGNSCDTEESLLHAIAFLDFRIECDSIIRAWGNTIHYSPTFGFSLKNGADTLKTILDKTEMKRRLEHNIRENISLLEDISFDNETLRELLQRVEYTKCFKIQSANQEKIDALLNVLSNPQFHPYAGQLRNTIVERDWAAYQKQRKKLEQLQTNQKEWVNHQQLIENCKIIFPLLTDDIIVNKLSSEQIDLLPRVLYWQVANSEFKKFVSQSEAELYENLKQDEKQIRDITAKLAADKAWIEVLGRIDNDLSRKLTLWAMAMNKAHGKGKKALQNRKAAQALMADCQQSVPCWIMPLPKLVETLRPEAAIYDYVIVDEASQLGPDAMFLMYLAKNIIIVGDDKQTAPQYVGIENDKVQDLINQYLKNIPYNSFFNIDYSFFDHAKAFCAGQKVVLREHFRCMPEIIGFSNKYFYEPEGIGLQPIKQYNQNRLEPLKTVFITGGNVEEGKDIKNYPEAEEIVTTIKLCLKDERYKSKTFGIIALQGQGQAQIINRKLLIELDSKEFEERKIICGDAKSFQGDERDVIFLSLVTAKNHDRKALTTEEYKRTFNVAVSRAQEQVWLFHSVELNDLKPNDLRYKLLHYFKNPLQPIISRNDIIENPKNLPKPFESLFEIDVYNEIVKKGYIIIPQYPVSSYRIDLVVILPNGIKIAVECDGDKSHSTQEQIANDIARQKILERAGWQFFRVRGGDFYYNREKALEKLWPLLERNNTYQIPDTTFIEYPKKSAVIEKEISTFGKKSAINITKELKTPLKANLQTELFPKNSGQIIIFEQPETLKSEIKPKNQSNNGKVNKEAESLSDDPEYMLIFTNQGRLYLNKNTHLTKPQILGGIQFKKGERDIYTCKTSDFNGFILFGFENGKVAKVRLDAYKTSHKSLESAYNSDSKLCFIKNIKEEIELLAYSKVQDGRTKAFIFNTETINPVGSKNSIGVQVMKIEGRGGKLDGLKTLDKVRLTDKNYYLRSGIPQVGVFLKMGDG